MPHSSAAEFLIAALIGNVVDPQYVHDAAPVRVANQPAAQSLHLTASYPSLNWPGAHATHAVAPL